MNLKWPAGKNNDYFPWYMIAWHGLWFIPYFIARFLFCIVVFIYNLSPQMLGRAWDDTR